MPSTASDTGLLSSLLGVFARNDATQSKPRQASTKGQVGKRSQYHCVAIHAGAGSCKAAKSIANKRFLSSEAPTFPLAQCDAGSCTCRYTHFNDRRSVERRNPASVVYGQLGNAVTEQRVRKDRRKLSI